MVHITEDDIRHLLHPTIFQRAQAYHQQGKILLFDEDNLGIQAVVEGSNGNSYDVFIDFDPDVGLIANCSCPYPHYCKHIGAVLLQSCKETEQADPRQYQREEYEEIIPTYVDTRGTFKSDRNPFLIKRSISSPGNNERRYKLIFLLERYWRSRYEDEEQWIVTPALRYIRKDGKEGRVEPFHWIDITDPLSPTEKLLVDVLTWQGRSNMPLSECIEQIVTSKEIALRYRKEGEVKELTVFPIHETTFRFSVVRIDNGMPLFSPYVSITDNDTGSTISLGLGSFRVEGLYCFFFDWQKGVLAFKKIDAAYIDIIDHLSYGNRMLLGEDIALLRQYIEQHNVPSVIVEEPEPQVKLLHYNPLPVLNLTELRNDFLSIDITFTYHGYLLGFPRYRQVIEVEDGDAGTIAALVRDFDQEDRWFFLLSSILPLTAGPDVDVEDDDFDWDDRWQHGSLPPTGRLLLEGENMSSFLIEYGDPLLSQGFTLRRDGKIINRLGPISISVSRNMDWLDMKVTAGGDDGGADDAGGPGDAHVLSPKHGTIEGNLLYENNTYYIINPEDISRLKHLYEYGQVRDDSFQISRYNYAVIDELYQVIENREDQYIREMKKIIEGLRRCSGIEPVSPPQMFNARLRDYQQAGLNWLAFLYRYSVNGCLADDMGLGKTVQTLALLQKLSEEKALETVLIVAPVNTLANWEEEIKRFTPALSVLLHHGPKRSIDGSEFSRYDLVLTSYHTVRNDIGLFSNIEFTYVILDEAQTIKNPSAQVYKCIRMLQGKHRLSLTGTPVENHTTELWAQMSFLNPGLLGSFPSFKRRFVRAVEEKEDQGKIKELNGIVYPFILRRTKTEVLQELPEKEEIVLYADMGPKQKQVYHEIKTAYQQRVLEQIEKEGINRAGILIIEALTKLRQAAILPEMVHPQYKGVASCKFELLFSVLEEVLREGYKVLLFSQFLRTLEVMKEWFGARNVEFSYIDGSTRDRAKQIELFQDDPLRKAFLISLKAGGVGINLTKADYVFLLDPWWNPASEQQAIDRAHRIGRTDKVIAYKLITRNTVEEKILVLQEKKKKLAAGLISSEQSIFKALQREDIQEIFA